MRRVSQSWPNSSSAAILKNGSFIEAAGMKGSTFEREPALTIFRNLMRSTLKSIDG